MFSAIFVVMDDMLISFFLFNPIERIIHRAMVLKMISNFTSSLPSFEIGTEICDRAPAS
jgi:hypothetical protein